MEPFKFSAQAQRIKKSTPGKFIILQEMEENPKKSLYLRKRNLF